ncbi:MAG: hypothetical protein A2X28_02150 [Elusimicrobia bacterium GWA2_56_46]|nr:MAG: hypothetical protein A2X28_02150 [Elusimicrobia bacterium GWA2_56_46]OGR55428.1 MAG: hypothetical protein A2X39_00815 [Elusimicrobia bacterium GWC2_56_31]HBW21894.1 hypothetical protein [Elusimicrobiota bacterium]
MRNAEKLRNFMQPGRIYRRQDLEAHSTAVDRDLNTLVESGAVRKLSGGIYYRPRKNAFGFTPPGERELLRAFLKTDDFLLTSYNYFNQFGLGLTQVYSAGLVYNHKRAGEYSLGGKRFEFRLVPAYPDKLSREFLLVDLLNNLRRLPDNTAGVLENLKTRLNEFDRAGLTACLERYGNPGAKKAFREIYA